MTKLYLVRHTQSIFNEQNRFGGWCDVNLSENGLNDAEKLGTKLKDIKFDYVYTSNLLRAQETMIEILKKNIYGRNFIVIHEDEKSWYSKFKLKSQDENLLKVIKTEKLNERYYGDLQGQYREDVKKKMGENKFFSFRRSFNISPPNGSKLEVTYDRVIKYFKENIIKKLKKNKNVLIVTHGNTIRSIIKYLDNISDKKIQFVEAELGKPIIYDFGNKMKNKIFPTNFALTKEIFDEKLKKISFSENIHIDFMDGIFTEKKSVSFEEMSNLKLLQNKNLQIHMMCYNPKKHIEKIIEYKINSVLIHIEVFKNKNEIHNEINFF